MSDKPQEPPTISELSKQESRKRAERPQASSKLNAWKKPHGLSNYYGPHPKTYQKLPEQNLDDRKRLEEKKADGDGNKEEDHPHVELPTPLEHGYSVPSYRPPPWVPASEIQGPTRILDTDEGTTSHPGPPLSAIQEGKVKAFCEPHLQVLCGPLLRYDTIRDGMWYGAVMIVTNDTESIYHPLPRLTVEWEAEDEKPFKLDEGIGENSPQGTPDGAVADPGANQSTGAAPGSSVSPTPPPKASPSDGTPARASFGSESSGYVSSDGEDEEPQSPTSPGSSASPTRKGHRKNQSSGSNWASSMIKKLKNLKIEGKSDFRGRPPERLKRTAKERQEREEYAKEWATKRVIEGEAIYKYAGIASTATFWRFLLEIPVNPDPTKGLKVHYAINKPSKKKGVQQGQDQDTVSTDITFHIAPTGSDMRFAAYSCNGFSQGVDMEQFRGEGFDSGFDPVWADLLERHEQRPFHALVGGGDQIYCDALMKEPELAEYVTLKTSQQKIAYPLTDSIMFTMDRFYFNHYCLVFRNGCFGKAISQIPMVNMLDDHDLIDGFGSYPEDLQRSTFFKQIGSRGYFWFLLFQQFTVDGVDGTVVEPGEHTFKSTIIGQDGAYIPFPSHSSLHYFGAHTWLLSLDCRSERRKDMVISPETYQQIFSILRQLPGDAKHLLILLGIPIAYPRMNLAEKLIHSDSVLSKLSRSGFSLPGFANKYNMDAELLDDLSDHWTARLHKKERNWLISQLQEIAMEKKVRISFISGDVHLAAVGCFKTYGGKKKQLHHSRGVPEPAEDHRWMVNIVTSAIVNTPPPAPAQATLNMLATHKHRTMHRQHTDEVMLPVFQEGLVTESRHLNYVAGSRNYTIGERDPTTGDMVFDIRVERKRGEGETKGYVVRAPPPKW